MPGKTIADGYVELRLDDSKLAPETRAKVDKVTTQFGTRLNQQLKRLNIDPVAIDADPRQALAAIDEAERRLRQLNDEAPTLDIRLRTQDALNELTRLKRRVGDVGEESATGFAARLSGRLGPLLASLPISGPMGTAIAAAGLASAPLLGAALAGGIIGGVGLGGIVGGFSVAKDDARVKGAIGDLGDEMERRLQRAAGAFIQPALRGVATVDRALETVDVDQIFADAARNVGELAEGAASSIEDLGDGIEALSANSAPVVAAISAGIAGISETISAGLKSLADNGPGAADALTTVLEIVNLSVGSVFMLVNGLTELYEINKKLGGDFGLQVMLKLTGAEMDKVDESARRGGGGTFELANGFSAAEEKAEKLKEQQAELKKVQDAVKGAQDALKTSLEGLGGQTTIAAQNAAGLKTAMDNLYGATITQTEANEGYQASFDELSETVKANSGEFKRNRDNLDLHTRAGRSNRDALQELLTKSGELYLADIAAGVAIDEARKKHEKRTKAVRDEADKVGLNKRETDKLIKTYGNIPPKKATQLVLDGVKKIAQTLHDLYVFQRALAEGIPVASMEAKLRNEQGPAKRFGGYAHGGTYDGMLPGPPSSVDNLLGYGPRGDVFGLAGGEYIVNAEQSRKHRPVLEAINSGLDGYAAGGSYPVDTSHRWPFVADLGKTFLMSRAQAESKVIPAGPGGGPTLNFLVSTIRRAFPGLELISGYRPGSRTLSGNLSYHGMRRAVDYPPSYELAAYMYRNFKSRLKEAITPYQEFNVHNGRSRRWTGAVWNQHNFAGGNAHDHFAMDAGGYLMPGWNPPIYNGTGRPEPVTPGADMDRMADRLDRLIEGQRRIGEDVALALTGAVRSTRQVGRAA